MRKLLYLLWLFGGATASFAQGGQEPFTPSPPGAVDESATAEDSLTQEEAQEAADQIISDTVAGNWPAVALGAILLLASFYTGRKLVFKRRNTPPGLK